MPKFYWKPAANAAVGDRLILCGDTARHLSLSLRLGVGDEVTLFDGEGRDLACRLARLSPTEVTAEVTAITPSGGELPFALSLYFGYPKGEKLDFIIEKAVELGACRIVPFVSSRCVRRPHEEKREKQRAREARIAESAACQCGRGRVPEVSAPLSFSAALAQAAAAELPLFCYEGKGTVPLAEVLLSLPAAPRSVAVITGAEGGFSPEEAAAARAAGCRFVGLGERILRCETAPLAALSFLSLFPFAEGGKQT